MDRGGPESCHHPFAPPWPVRSILVPCCAEEEEEEMISPWKVSKRAGTLLCPFF